MRLSEPKLSAASQHGGLVPALDAAYYVIVFFDIEYPLSRQNKRLNPRRRIVYRGWSNMVIRLFPPMRMVNVGSVRAHRRHILSSTLL